MERKIRRKIERHVLPEIERRVPFFRTDEIIASAVGMGAFDHLDIDARSAAGAVLLHNPRELRAHIVEEFIKSFDMLGFGDADAVRPFVLFDRGP